MPRYKTFFPAGRVVPNDVNGIQDAYGNIFIGYKLIDRRVGRVLSVVTTNTFILSGYPGGNVAINTTNARPVHTFHLPTGFAAGSRNPKVIAVFNIEPQVNVSGVSLTFGFGTATLSTGNNTRFIVSVASEASGLVTSLTDGVPTRLVLGPITITNNTERIFYVTNSGSSISSNISANIDLYMYQE